MSSVLLLLLLCPRSLLSVPVAGPPPAPVDLRVTSVNLKHVLQWDRGPGTSAETSYRVTFHTDRSRCCPVVPGCERVQGPLSCDLTDAFSDPDETYHVQVTAQHRSEQSTSALDDFLPIRDSELQPPVLQVELCNSSLCVHVASPVPRLHSLYDKFHYELKVENSGTQQHSLVPFWSLGSQVVPGLGRDSRYCVSVRFADPIVPRESSFGPAQCVVPHRPPTTAPEVVLLSLPGLLLLLLVLAALLYYASIVCEKPSLPSVLTSVLHVEEKLDVSCHPTFSSVLLVEAVPPGDHTEDCSSETDDSERESEEAEGSATSASFAFSAHYKSKASLCSQRTSSSSLSGQASVHSELMKVDLLTLTFSRDTEEPRAGEDEDEEEEEEEVPLEELMEDENQGDSEEECFGSGYMSKPPP